MRFNVKNSITILLSIALILSVLVAAGIFDNGEIVIEKAYDDEAEVYIVGDVKVPGIYVVKKGSILNDLVEKAGGLNETVNVENVNLAYRIDRNMMIKVLSDTILEMDDLTGIAVYDEELSDLMININTALPEELILIPGIGLSTAGAIIDYREANGRFEKIEDIMKVNGIKEARFLSIKEFICVK